jgi:predicted transcriptional regulator
MSSDGSDFGASMTKMERHKRQILTYVEANGGECLTEEVFEKNDIPQSTGYRAIKQMEEAGKIERGSSITNPHAKTVIVPNDK